ncbi:MAG: PDZ domain-containing protein [Rhodospirillales bacterium]|nr:MAG: PDZ domain-containing protein [Rhodospirillales bacterium]
MRDHPVMLGRAHAVLVLFALVTVGCSAIGDRGEDSARGLSGGDPVAAVLRAAYTTISDRYVDPIDPAALVLSGLNGLSAIDPAVHVVAHGAAIEIEINGTVAARMAMPEPDDVRGWSDLSATSIAVVREASPLVATTPQDRILDVVLAQSIASLDRFSRYATANEAVGHRARRQGYGGVGIRFRQDGGHVVVTDVMDDSPAARADVRVGDRITHIDGADLNGETAHRVALRLRGPVGSRLRLTMARDGLSTVLQFELERMHLITPTVRLRDDDGILYVAVSGFNQDTARSLALALGSGLADYSRGVVLDLRGNPGGLLHQSILVADLFLAGGRIVMTQGRHPDSRQLYLADDHDAVAGAPMVVVLDGGSASAAEIVAAALKDRGRAVVLGTSSYGKGTVQTVAPLPNDGELVLTWSRLISPSGRIIGTDGVIPTLCTSGIEKPSRGDPQQVLRNATRRPPIPAEASPRDCPAEHHAKDTDLRVARAVLADPGLYRRFVVPVAGAAAVAEMTLPVERPVGTP